MYVPDLSNVEIILLYGENIKVKKMKNMRNINGICFLIILYNKSLPYRSTQNGTLWVRRPKTPPKSLQNSKESGNQSTAVIPSKY